MKRSLREKNTASSGGVSGKHLEALATPCITAPA